MSWAEAQYIIDETAGKVEEAAKNLDETATRIAAGIPPQDMQAFSVMAMDGGAKLKFTEPADTYIEGQRICSVKGVKIVMKQGGYPVDENDGTLIIDNTEPGKYSSEALIIDGLENDTEYFISAFPYSDSGHYNRAAGLQIYNDSYAVKNRAKFTPQEYILYGYKRTKGDSNPATRLVATDMAVGMGAVALDTTTGALDLKEWANAWFVKENKPVMLKYDGTIDYELNPDDYTLKADGTASDVANSSYEGNAMALFPTCWVKRWQDDTYEYFQVCNIQLTDDFKAYAHQREDGSIMEWFARSIYDGANVSSKIRSISGLTPCNTVAGNTQLTYAQANGDLWECDTWSRVALIWDLLRLMALNDDVQAAYGYGRYTGQSSSSTNYLKTGTGNQYGQFYGKGVGTSEVVKVFHCENLWGNIWKLMQGLVYNTTGKYGVKMCRPYSTSGSGYVAMSFGLSGTSGGYQSAHNMSEYGLLPTTVSGSDSTYIPDGAWFSTSQQCLARFGGAGNNGLLVGCALRLDYALSYSYWHFGLGLTCEQPLAA